MPFAARPRPKRYLKSSDRHAKLAAGLQAAQPEKVYLRVSGVIQEHGLEFQHEGRNIEGSTSESTLKEDSHSRLMEHSFASYV